VFSTAQIADELLRGKEFLAAQGLASAELQKANKGSLACDLAQPTHQH
jgi:hypothetical protein